MEKKILSFFKKLVLALLVGVAGYLLWLPIRLHAQRWGWNYMATRHEDWGLFGDYIGGLIGTVFTSITLFFLIFQEHRAKLRRVKEDAARRLQEIISVHRDVLASIKMHAYEHGIAIPKEGVEAMRRLYVGHYLPSLHARLIPLAKALAQADDHSWKEMVRLGAWSGFEIQTKEDFLEKVGWWSDIFIVGNKRFHDVSLLKNLDSITASLPPETSQSVATAEYEFFFQAVGYLFGHYHRNLFYVLQELDESPYSDAEKDRHGKFFRSMLSGAELVMIHLNMYCGYDRATSGDNKFRRLIEKYKILEDLDMHMFAHREVYRRNLGT